MRNNNIEQVRVSRNFEFFEIIFLFYRTKKIQRKFSEKLEAN